MTPLALFPILFGDLLVNGLAAGSVGVVGYLWWLGAREKRTQRAAQKESERRRREYWGEP